MIIELLVSATTVVSGPAELKCPRTHTLPGMPPDVPVVVLDGVIVEDATPGLEGVVSPEEVAHVEVACWNPETDEIPAKEGVQLILVTTNDYVAARRREVEEVVAALEAFSSARGRAPSSLAELGHDVGAERFEYRTSESGWSVSNGSTPVAHRCSAEWSPDREADVTCEQSYDLVRRALRKRYASGFESDGSPMPGS